MTGGRDNKKRVGDERFVRNVLDRTSGSPCARAEMQLPALVDGELELLDRQLAQAHLEHCEDCRSLAVVLGWLGPELPGLAKLDPGPAFTHRVLAATSRRQRVELDLTEPAGLAGLMDRVGRWWEGHILKPGFAMQAAYAATVVIVLLTAVPGAPLRGVPERALGVIAAGPTTMPVVETALDAVGDWVATRSEGARTAVGRRWDGYESDLRSRNARSQPARGQLAGHVDSMLDLAGDGKLGEAGYELLGALRATRRTWQDWWHDDKDTNVEQRTR